MKRIICLLIALVMTVSAVPVFAATVYTYYCEDGLVATVDVGAKTLTLSGEGDMMDYTAENRPPWYERKSLYTSVIVEEGITSIGDYAFADNLVLVSAKIPNSVTRVGDYGFHHCIKLTEMHFSDNVKEIGIYALADCNSLKSVTLPKTLKEIPRALFRCTYYIENLVMPEDCPSLGDQAFMSCSYIKSIDLPDNLKYIGNYAFSGCNALSSVTIPDGTEHIGDFAFYQLTVLKEIKIPKSVNYIGEDAFCSTPWYNALSDGFNLVNGIAITYKGSATAKTLKIPEGTRKIAPGVCGKAVNATQIIIPDSVTEICEYAFYDLTSLYSVTIPDSVESVGEYAFGYYMATSGYPAPMYPFTIYSYGNDAAKSYAEDNQFDYVCLHKEGAFVNYPDCTVGGIANKICVSCGEIIGEISVDAGSHNFGPEEVFEATCTEDGYTKNICLNCGYEKITVTISATGHTADGGIKIKDATCEENGLIYKVCADCGDIFDEFETVKLSHEPLQTQTEIKEPTCTEDGEYAILCKHCEKELEKGIIPAKGHTPAKNLTVLIESDYGNGVKGLYVKECADCGIVLEYSNFIRGDANKDNRLNARDTMSLKRAIMGGTTATDELKFIGDMNRDGRLNARDTMSLKRLISNT